MFGVFAAFESLISLTFLFSQGTSEEPPSQDDYEHLREQLSTLMSTLATLTQEKSEMEANFKADKKKIRVSSLCVSGFETVNCVL